MFLDCVHSCSGRKFEHALKHGLHRGLYVVTLPWFLNSAKQYGMPDLFSLTLIFSPLFFLTNFFWCEALTIRSEPILTLLSPILAVLYVSTICAYRYFHSPWLWCST